MTSNSELEQTIAQLQQLQEKVSHLYGLPERLEYNYVANYLGLPGLRGFWNFGNYNENILLIDMSGQGRSLSRGGSATLQHSEINSIVPSTFLVAASSRYWFRNHEAGFNILGNEFYISTPARGLTLGIWVNPTAFSASVNQGIIGKWDTPTNQRQYLIYLPTPTNTQPYFSVSGNGVSTVTVVAPTEQALQTNKWYCIVGRFIPSVSLDLFINGKKTSNVTNIPGSLFGGTTSQFNIGAFNNGTAGYFDGYASMAFITSQQLSDYHIYNLYQNTRGLFGT